MPRRRRWPSSTIDASGKRPICVASRRNSTRRGRPRSKAMSRREKKPPQPWSLRGMPTAKPAGPTDPQLAWRALGFLGFLAAGFGLRAGFLSPLSLPAKRQKATRRKAFAPQFTIINFLEPRRA